MAAGHVAGALTGGAAMLGHWRPIFLRFAKGGKTVATCGGALLGLAPIVGLIGVVVWLVVFALTRYASVSSIIAAAVAADRRARARRAVAGARLHERGSRRRAPAAPREPRAPARGDRDPRPAPAEDRAAPSQRAGEPLAQLGVVLERAALLELAAQLADRAVALREHVVRVDRLEVHLAREDEVAVVESGVRIEDALQARAAPSPRRTGAAGEHARRRRARRAA